MRSPTIRNLLDFHEDIRRKMDDGAYVVEVDQIEQPEVEAAQSDVQSLHSRTIHH